MRQKKVWRYYCDHCNKSGCSAGHMKRHERGCTRNPERVCGLCIKMNDATSGDHGQEPISLLIDALTSGGIDALRTAAGGCPACMLAAILQERRRRGVQLSQLGHEDAAEEWSLHGDFDYRTEHTAFWKIIHANTDF